MLVNSMSTQKKKNLLPGQAVLAVGIWALQFATDLKFALIQQTHSPPYDYGLVNN